MRRSTEIAVGSSDTSDARQAGAFGRRAGPAEARADSRWRALGSILKEIMRSGLNFRRVPARCSLLVLAFAIAAASGATAQSASTGAQAPTNTAPAPARDQTQELTDI